MIVDSDQYGRLSGAGRHGPVWGKGTRQMNPTRLGRNSVCVHTEDSAGAYIPPITTQSRACANPATMCPHDASIPLYQVKLDMPLLRRR